MRSITPRTSATTTAATSMAARSGLLPVAPAGRAWLAGGVILAVMILPTVTVALIERLETIRDSLSRGRERMDTWTLELQRHGEEAVEREVRWLNELIDNARDEEKEMNK